MATGDKTASTRPRGESNMRLDLVDYAAMAIASQYAIEAAVRSLLSSPKAVAGVATGERWSGSMTANPTGVSDGLFRLDSDVFVGVDANGGMAVKPNGTAVSIAVPGGGANYQVYAYVADVSEDTQVRRFLPATAPFNEFAAAINVALRQTVGLFVRAGSLGSVVAEDVVAGVTRPLLFLGIASNTAGVVTFTPGTNTLETVRAPATVPATDSGTTTVKTTVTGAGSTLRDLLNAALYALGNAMFKGSDFITPADANNWGAYSTALLSGGVDKAYRQAVGFVTIGNGTTIFGDFNTNAYANAKLCLDAALASLPAAGGVIHLKRGVTLSGFGGSTVTLPNKNVVIQGDAVGLSTQITFVAGEFLICGLGTCVFRNLNVSFVTNVISLVAGQAEIRDCIFSKTLGADAGAAITGTNIDSVIVENVQLYTALNAITNNAMGVRISGTASRVRISGFDHIFNSITNGDCGTISIADVRDNVLIENVTTRDPGGTSIVGGSTAACVTVSSTDNATQIRSRIIRNVTTQASAVRGIDIGNCGWLTIDDCVLTSTVAFALRTGNFTTGGRVLVRGCRIATMNMASAFSDLRFDSCEFGSIALIGDAAQAQGIISFTHCKFTNPNTVNQALSITGTTIDSILIANCTFTNYGSTTVADFGMVKIRAGTSVQLVSIVDNTINGFQNVAYAGADATSSPRMFEVDVAQAGVINCTGNVAYNIMSTSTGNTRKGAYLLDVDYEDRAGNAAFSIGEINCSNNCLGRNVFGATTAAQDYVMLMKLARSRPQTINILGNMLTTIWNEVAGTSQLNHIVWITPVTLTTSLCNLNIAQNSFRILANASATIDVELVLVDVSFTLEQLTFIGNMISLVNEGWNLASAWGLRVTMAIVNLNVLGNACNVQGSVAATAKFETRLTGGVTRNNTGGAIPGAGVAWANNTLIFGG